MIPIDLWRARIGLFNCKRCSSSFLSSLFSPSPCVSCHHHHHPPRERHKIVTEESSTENSPTENNHTSHPSNLSSSSLNFPRDSSPFPLKEQTSSLEQCPSSFSPTASISTTSSTSSSSWSGSLSSLRRSLLRDVLIILLIAIISQQLIVLSGDIETNPGPKHGANAKPSFSDLQCMSIVGDKEPFRLMDRLRPHWKEFAIALGFPPHSIATIEGSNDPLYKLLSEWLRGANLREDTRPVTWKTLIDALHMANIHEEADTLEKHFVLTDKRVVASQFGKRKHSEVEQNQEEGTALIAQEPKRAKVDDPESCGKILVYHSSGGYTMSHGPIQVSLKPDVPERVVVLMKEYAKMLLVLRTAKLSKAELATLKMFLSDYCEEFSIRKCSTVSSIVDQLIKHLKIYIFNIDTLNASCEYFSSLEVNHSVEQYKQHLDRFLSSTSIKEFKETLQTQIVNPESIECITLKLDENRATCTLKKLRELVFHFFGNISKAFIHCETFAGCVCVTWIVPISLVPTLRTMAQQLTHEYLASHGVLELVIGLRIAPNDKGSKVKEDLKDDVEMHEFLSEAVSKVKIEKPQSDKEYGHESEITSFSSDEYEQKFSESLPLTVSSILEQFICYLKHGYLTTEVRPRSLVSLDINDECFFQPFDLHVCNSAGFNRSVDPRSSTNTDIFQFSFSSSNRRDKIKLHGYKHCQNEHKMKLDMADIGKYTDTSTGQLQLAKSILVEGCQGVGKSVLAWKLCKGWAEGELLQEWPIVIVLNFRNRHVREAKTVNDLIYHPDQAMRERVCQELVESEGSQVLAILDGYDQLSDEQETNCSIFKKLVTRSLFPQATLMLLSRRVATGALPEEFLSSINQHIVISGFTDENVKSFITSASNDNLDLASALGSYLNSQSLSYLQIHTPLQCTILTDLYCFHWKNCDKSFAPRTRTELYTDLVRTLLVQYLSSHSEYSKSKWNIVEFTDLPGEVYEQFKALAQLAARGIQERVYVFDSGVPEDTLGLMYQVAEMYPDRNRSVSYSFLHLTLQEYLAAYYCSLEETNVRLTKVLKLKESIETFLNLYCIDEMVDYMHHWPVLLFAASITKLSWNPQVLHELLQFYSHRQHFVASLVHLLYEIHSPELIALTFQSTADQSTDFKLNITGQGLSDLFVTGYCIPCSNSLWQYTPHDSATTEHFLDFLKGLQLASSSSCGGHIAKMEVNYYRHVSMLPLLHPHTQRLKELKITYGGLTWMFSGNKKVNCTNVYRKFPHYYPLLEVLEVRAKHSSDIVHLELFESLTRLNSLERLKMRLHYTTPAEINLMCVYLQACQIRHLVLKDTHTARKSTLPLMISRKLESLKLCCFSLTSTWAQSICSLRTLHLKYCTFPNDASTALIHSLQSPHCVLHTLELSNAGEYEDEIKYSRVPDTLLGVLVSGSLKRCFLRLNDLSGIEHLISGLKGNNTLEELWVLDEPCLEFWSQLHGCGVDRVQDLIRVVNDNTSIKHLKLSCMYEEASKRLKIRPSLKVDYVDNPHDIRDYSEFN